MLPANAHTVKTRYAEALRSLQQGRLTAAETAFRDLAKLVPKSAEVHYQLSRIAEARGDQTARAEALATARAIKPNEPALIEAALDAATRLGRTDEVCALYDLLAKLSPKDLKPRVDKAVYLQSIGDFDAAEALFRKLIRANPYDGELYRIFLGTSKIGPADPLMGKMRKALAHPRMSDQGKMHLNFAMAKVLEDQGKSKMVFPHLKRANALQGTLAPHDPDERDAEQAAFLEAQSAGDLTPVGDPVSPRPIFVTGMPRSGTTLVEQIIGSHSAVTAGGEIGVALKIATRRFGSDTSFADVSGLSDTDLAAFAKDYLGAVHRMTGANSASVTDKSIQSHLIYGLLHRALPGARFIVVHRDPRDIALSIYKNHFKLGTHRYATDLAAIAATIKRFRHSIAFWKSRLPDVLTEVRYDALVSDPDQQTRRLIAAAGLEWEDGCLEFHKVRGTVKTLSLHQVRQPIYQRSAQAWRRYASELQPFIDAWGDTPWD